MGYAYNINHLGTFKLRHLYLGGQGSDPCVFQMYKHHAELIFSGPLMGSPTCSTTDVLLSWACLAEQQLCVEELTLGSIIPRGVFLPGVEGVLRRA